MGNASDGSKAGDVLGRYLSRQERAVLAKVGAGVSVNACFSGDRWSKELSDDISCSLTEARRFIGVLSDEISCSIGPLRDTKSRVAAARLVYAHAREKARPTFGRPKSGAGVHMVYQLYGLDGELLYIGITDRGPVRLAEHYRKKSWFSEVCQVEFERYETRSESEERESSLIRRRRPLYNIQHNMGRQVSDL